MAAGEVLGEIWAVAAPGGALPVDVRVFVRGVTNQRLGLTATPQRILTEGVAMSSLIVQNLGAIPIELGNDRGLQYGQGMRIAPNSILSGGAITPGGPGAAVVESYARAALPAVGNRGRLVDLLDYDRGLWLDDGAAWRSLGFGTFDPSAFGVVDDTGVLDSSAAFQAALNAAEVVASAGTVGARVVVPPGNFLLTTALTKAANVALKGAGMFSTTLRFSGAINGIVEDDAGSGVYTNAGAIEELQIIGQSGALVGVKVDYRREVLIRRCRLQGFAEQAVHLNHTVLASIEQSQFGTSGDATHAVVEVDNSTTFMWNHSYISGSASTTVAGLRIDRTGNFTILGGAFESTGIPIQLAGKSEGTTSVGPGVIHGTDLENPNNGAITYIEFGAGWTGTAGQGVRHVSVLGVNGSISGSATVTRGIRAVHSDSIYVAQSSFGLAAGTDVTFDLVGAAGNNLRWSLGINGGPRTPIYVQQNSATRPDARPDQPWWLIGMGPLVLASNRLEDATAWTTGGYSFLKTSSSVARLVTNMNGATGIAPQEGQIAIIEATDGNTTLVQTAGGAGQFLLRAGVNLALTIGHTYAFIYHADITAWTEVRGG